MSDTLLADRAPAKVNLTLHVLGRRPDGYHELDSVVVFAGAADRLTLRPGEALSISVDGPTAGAAGLPDDNLVLRAARNLVERRAGLLVGAFHLTKRLPAAAGIGGGSSDAAAALRLLARLNGIAPDDAALLDAARSTGADVPVCLDPQARTMRGAGEVVGPPLAIPALFAVLVNPGVSVPTPAVFQAMGLQPGELGRTSTVVTPGLAGPAERASDKPEPTGGTPGDALPDHGPSGGSGLSLGKPGKDGVERSMGELLKTLSASRNDLEPPAVALQPVIGEALARLRATAGCRLARMSGSGATCFGLYGDRHAAVRAAQALRASRPGWWITPTVLR